MIERIVRRADKTEFLVGTRSWLLFEMEDLPTRCQKTKFTSHLLEPWWLLRKILEGLRGVNPKIETRKLGTLFITSGSGGFYLNRFAHPATII